MPQCIICERHFDELPDFQECFHCFHKYGPPPKPGDKVIILGGGDDTPVRYHRFLIGDVAVCTGNIWRGEFELKCITVDDRHRSWFRPGETNSVPRTDFRTIFLP